jgi:hypothetical protein
MASCARRNFPGSAIVWLPKSMSRRRKEAAFDADANEKNHFFVIAAIVTVLIIGLILIFSGLFD